MRASGMPSRGRKRRISDISNIGSASIVDDGWEEDDIDGFSVKQKRIPPGLAAFALSQLDNAIIESGTHVPRILTLGELDLASVQELLGNDAETFVRLVQQFVTADEFLEFIDTLENFNAKKLSLREMMVKISWLLQGNPVLHDAFDQFLPPSRSMKVNGYLVKMGLMDSEQELIVAENEREIVRRKQAKRPSFVTSNPSRTGIDVTATPASDGTSDAASVPRAPATISTPRANSRASVEQVDRFLRKVVAKHGKDRESKSRIMTQFRSIPLPNNQSGLAGSASDSASRNASVMAWFNETSESLNGDVELVDELKALLNLPSEYNAVPSKPRRRNSGSSKDSAGASTGSVPRISPARFFEKLLNTKGPEVHARAVEIFDSISNDQKNGIVTSEYTRHIPDRLRLVVDDNDFLVEFMDLFNLKYDQREVVRTMPPNAISKTADSVSDGTDERRTAVLVPSDEISSELPHAAVQVVNMASTASSHPVESDAAVEAESFMMKVMRKISDEGFYKQREILTHFAAMPKPVSNPADRLASPPQSEEDIRAWFNTACTFLGDDEELKEQLATRVQAACPTLALRKAVAVTSDEEIIMSPSPLNTSVLAFIQSCLGRFELEKDRLQFIRQFRSMTTDAEGKPSAEWLASISAYLGHDVDAIERLRQIIESAPTSASLTTPVEVDPPIDC